MEKVLSLINDLVIILFNCGLYINLTPPKKDTKLYKIIMYIGCAVCTIAYMVATYVFEMPYALASSLCLTIPTFILFFILAKYKNSRFLVTFCFVDSITLMLAAIAKIGTIYGGVVGGIISCVCVIAICVTSFILLFPQFPKYREIMDNVEKGWHPMAISGVLIYALLIISAAYPKPLIERKEYIPIYLFISVTTISFYGVFLLLIKEKSHLVKANELLKKQQHWHQLAYLDTLTQLSNKAAYDAKVLELETNKINDKKCDLIMIDLDKFKNVNDTYGHLVGNDVLKNTADFFLKTFNKDNYTVYRVGGDEFVVIAIDVEETEIEEMKNIINSAVLDDNLGCTFSCGYSQVDFNEEMPFEQAFFKADKKMYAEKAHKKEAN